MCGLHHRVPLPTLISSFMELSSVSHVACPRTDFASLIWTPRRLVHTNVPNITKSAPLPLLSGWLPGTPNCIVIESFVSTCPSVSMFTATLPTKRSVTTGQSSLITGAATSHHLWGGTMVPTTSWTTLWLSLGSLRMPSLMLRPTDGAMISCTQQIGDGTQRRTMLITSHGRDSQRNLRLMTDL